MPIAKRKAIGERTAWTSKRKINRIETLTQKYKKEMINSMTNEEAQEIPTQPLTYYYFSTGAWVQLTVWNKLIDFLVDTEAIYSVLNIKATKKSSAVMLTTGVSTGVTKQFQKLAVLQPVDCKLGFQKPRHSFFLHARVPNSIFGLILAL